MVQKFSDFMIELFFFVLLRLLKVLNHASRTLRLPYTNLKKSCTEKTNRLLSMRSRDNLQGK